MKHLITLAGACLCLIIFGSVAFSQNKQATIAREYYTEYGLLTFAVDGSQITGSYPHEDGKLVGKLEGYELKARWRQRDGSGSIIITFAPDFSTFKARYNHVDTPDKWATDWSGMRKPSLVVRKYKTPWGALSCEFQGRQVSCTYPWYNGKILGELKGQTFTGLWLQSNTGVGTLNISFADDFSSFKGTYNDFNHHPDKWNAWSGTLMK